MKALNGKELDFVSDVPPQGLRRAAHFAPLQAAHDDNLDFRFMVFAPQKELDPNAPDFESQMMSKGW
jgi:hypothetical protein